MPEPVKNLLLLLVSVTVALLIADGLFRLYERSARVGDAAISEAAVDLAALNYNDSAIERAGEPNQYRVLSLGDSFAYTITKYPYSYHGIAAALLDDRLADRSVRVVNLGQPSISFYQYIEAYRFWRALIDHDAVVFNIYLGNDILDVAYAHVPERVKVQDAFERFHYSLQTGQIIPARLPRKFPLRMFDYLYAWYHIWRGDIRAGDDAGTGPYNYSMLNLAEERYYAVLHKQLDNFDPAKLSALAEGYEAVGAFAAFVSEIRRSGRPVEVMLSPSELQVTPDLQQVLAVRFDLDPGRYDYELPAWLVQEIFDRVDSRIPVLHLFDAFRCATDAGADLYYGTDTHWTAEGNRLAGEVLASFLGRHWFGLEGEASTDPGCAKAGAAPRETVDRHQAFANLWERLQPRMGAPDRE